MMYRVGMPLILLLAVLVIFVILPNISNYGMYPH